MSKLEDIIATIYNHYMISNEGLQIKNVMNILTQALKEDEEDNNKLVGVGDIVIFQDHDEDMEMFWNTAIVRTEIFRDLLNYQRPHSIIMRACDVNKKIEALNRE
jgi:hypothetical protein